MQCIPDDSTSHLILSGGRKALIFLEFFNHCLAPVNVEMTSGLHAKQVLSPQVYYSLAFPCLHHYFLCQGDIVFPLILSFCTVFVSLTSNLLLCKSVNESCKLLLEKKLLIMQNTTRLCLNISLLSASFKNERN